MMDAATMVPEIRGARKISAVGLVPSFMGQTFPFSFSEFLVGCDFEHQFFKNQRIGLTSQKLKIK